MRDRVLIVDDVEINRIILREILRDEYDIMEAEDGIQAIEVLFSHAQAPNAVLLDIMMPGMDGFEVLEVMQSDAVIRKIPVLFITAADADTNESRGISAGAVDYISKPFNPEVVKARLRSHIQLMKYSTQLEELVEIKTAEMTKTYERTLETLATIIEYRNLESGTHIRRTSELVKILVNHIIQKPQYKELLESGTCNLISKAVALHDIGKIGIRDSVLLKPGKLTAEEFEEVKQHSRIGGEIIETIARGLTDDAAYLKICYEICRSHHERWDGRGYPDGLKGEEIPLPARMTSIVDVYDALVNLRCYKPQLSHEEAVQIIVEGKGTQFDPGLVDCFLEVDQQFKALEEELGDE